MPKKAVHKPEPGNEAPIVNERAIVKLAVPVDLYNEYDQLADKQGLTVQELMLHRLTRCKDFNGVRPLFFSDAQRSQLEGILQKRPLESAEQALAALQACLSLRIGDFEPIPLPGPLVKRIGLSAYGGQSPQDRLSMLVLSALHKAVGL